MGKIVIPEGLAAIAEKNAAKMGNNPVSLNDFDQHGITNATDSIFEKDCTIEIPSEENLNETPGLIDFETFTTNGRTSRAPYIWCPANNGFKKLFISQLVRQVSNYKEENGGYVRYGEPVHSDTKLYNELKDLRDAGSILRKVLGKTLKVVEVKEGSTARFTGNVVTGLRDYRLACFEVVDKK